MSETPDNGRPTADDEADEGQGHRGKPPRPDYQHPAHRLHPDFVKTSQAIGDWIAELDGEDPVDWDLMPPEDWWYPEMEIPTRPRTSTRPVAAKADPAEETT